MKFQCPYCKADVEISDAFVALARDLKIPLVSHCFGCTRPFAIALKDLTE